MNINKSYNNLMIIIVVLQVHFLFVLWGHNVYMYMYASLSIGISSECRLQSHK